jgi:hypothetical protein
MKEIIKNEKEINYDDIRKKIDKIDQYRNAHSRQGDIIGIEKTSFAEMIKSKHKEDYLYRRIFHLLNNSGIDEEKVKVIEDDYEGEDSIVNFIDRLYEEIVEKSEKSEEFILGEDEYKLVNEVTILMNLIRSNSNIEEDAAEKIFENLAEEFRQKNANYKNCYLWYKLLKKSPEPDLKIIDKMDFESDSVSKRLDEEYRKLLDQNKFL